MRALIFILLLLVCFPAAAQFSASDLRAVFLDKQKPLLEDFSTVEFLYACGLLEEVERVGAESSLDNMRAMLAARLQQRPGTDWSTTVERAKSEGHANATPERCRDLKARPVDAFNLKAWANSLWR